MCTKVIFVACEESNKHGFVSVVVNRARGWSAVMAIWIAVCVR